jgi:hypothetical protein
MSATGHRIVRTLHGGGGYDRRGRPSREGLLHIGGLTSAWPPWAAPVPFTYAVPARRSPNMGALPAPPASPGNVCCLGLGEGIFDGGVGSALVFAGPGVGRHGCSRFCGGLVVDCV